MRCLWPRSAGQRLPGRARADLDGCLLVRRMPERCRTAASLEEKYRARGLQLIRSVSYDNNLPAWEFQKHYRLPFVQLLDPIREFESHYNCRRLVVSHAGRRKGKSFSAQPPRYVLGS